ncbi:MAG: hypothetical protein E6R09_05160 [Rhodocyclaceae bacterium]|nr:MAG: hypothetical protein E6R09_05160 [Rhodocyclaceae bacterium]
MSLSSNRGAKRVTAAWNGKLAADRGASPHRVAGLSATRTLMGRRRRRRVQAASTVPAAF